MNGEIWKEEGGIQGAKYERRKGILRARNMKGGRGIEGEKYERREGY